MFGLFKKKNKEVEETEPLYLFDTEASKKRLFKSLHPGEVTMYTCGPTVYDFAHIGNLRTYVFSDILKRVLEYNNFEVSHTMNFTDFGHLTSDADTGEDKMMKGLKREGVEVSLESMHKFSDRYIKIFKEDAELLNIIPPTQYARASDFVTEQIALIKTLDEKGYTYETSDGLYFDISKFPKYGRLGKIKIDAQRSDIRTEVNTEKKHSADFAVWKKGELGWESKWGKGFPGWHIECSAMAFATLGHQIDIHTGGVDNAPTHHNGEIAQSESATGKQFVQYWLHGEHLQIADTKISKSLGHSFNLRDLLEKGYTGEEYRYWLLTSHYRSPVNFTLDALDGAKQALTRLKRHIFEEYNNKSSVPHSRYMQAFLHIINNDLDTAGGIALMWEMIKDKELTSEEKVATVREFDKIFAIGLSDSPEEIEKELGTIDIDKLPEDIQQMVNEREVARAIQNWTEADRLREALEYKGYSIEDSSDGPKIIKAGS